MKRQSELDGDIESIWPNQNLSILHRFFHYHALINNPHFCTKTQNSDVWNSTPNVHASGPPILAETSTALTDATKILYHRGPDGYQTSRGVYGPQRWSMGHTRLAIVDPSNRQADM